jgi:hypothetical protein
LTSEPFDAAGAGFARDRRRDVPAGRIGVGLDLRRYRQWSTFCSSQCSIAAANPSVLLIQSRQLATHE